MSETKKSNQIRQVCREVFEKSYEAIRQGKKYMRGLGVGAILAGGWGGTDLMGQESGRGGPPDHRANIIFILADDLGWTDINCREGAAYNDQSYNPNNPQWDGTATAGGGYDSSYYHTPNIATLRRAGVRFTNAYACPLCSPTRASLMTGKYSARLGMTGFPVFSVDTQAKGKIAAAFTKKSLPHEETTIAEALKAVNSDFETCFIGKWQLCGNSHQNYSYPSRYAYYPNRPENGFKHSVGHTTGVGGIQGYYWERGVYDDLDLIGMTGTSLSLWEETLWGDPGHVEWYNDNYGRYFAGMSRRNEYLTDSYTVKALDFLDRVIDKSNPYFLYLAHVAPHDPLQAKKDYLSHYSRGDPRGIHKNATYAAMIESLDESVGVIMKKITENEPIKYDPANGQYVFAAPANTYIVFFSDNGGEEYDDVEENVFVTDNYPLDGGKRQLYEGGIRVPLIIAGPAAEISPNSTCDIPVNSCDLWPTFLELANENFDADNYSDIDGVSLAPLLEYPDGSTFLRENEPDDSADDDALFWHEPQWWTFRDGEDVSQEQAPCTVVRKKIDGQEYKLIKFYNRDFGKGVYDYRWEAHFNHDTLQLKYNVPGRYELYNLSAPGGKIGGALQLFGKGDYVETSYEGILGKNSRTVAGWIKLSGRGGGDCDVIYWGDAEVRGGKWLLGIEDGIFRVSVSGGYISGSSYLCDGRWHHLAAVLKNDGSPTTDEIKIFVDAKEEITSGVSCDIDTLKDDKVRIGGARSRYFNGLLDDWRIYDEALTYEGADSELGKLADDDPATNPPPTHLAAYWNLDETEGQTAYDAVANPPGKDGILRGAYAWYPYDINERRENNLYGISKYDEIAVKLKELIEGKYDGRAGILLKSGWLEKVGANMPMLPVVRLKANMENQGVYSIIQAAINEAGKGDIIVVCPGVHLSTSPINFYDSAGRKKDVKLTSINPDDPEVRASTVIYGDHAGPVVRFHRANSADCELTGLTITSNNQGRGIDGEGSAGAVSKCIIRNNKAAGDNGGGIAHFGGFSVISASLTTNTRSTCPARGGLGGGLYNCGGTIKNCLIVQNTADFDGGGMYHSNVSPKLINCTIANNGAGNTIIPRTGYGGGIYNDKASYPTLRNCILWGNDDTGSENKQDKQIFGKTPNVTFSCIKDADPGAGTVPFGGAGNHNIDAHPQFVNQGQEWDYTQADSRHGSEPNYVLIKVGKDKKYQVGEIIEINNDGVRREIKTVKEMGENTQFITFLPPLSPPALRNTIIYKWDLGVVSVIENYRLEADSPCCDAGDNLAVDESEDLEGNPRMSGNPQVDDTGSGKAPLVDMGAYEWIDLKDR